jgi:hypothetical protein
MPLTITLEVTGVRQQVTVTATAEIFPANGLAPITTSVTG